jgi:hypothetical protein
VNGIVFDSGGLIALVCAQSAGYAVVTSDPLDLKRLDPKLRLIAV